MAESKKNKISTQRAGREWLNSYLSAQFQPPSNMKDKLSSKWADKRLHRCMSAILAWEAFVVCFSFRLPSLSEAQALSYMIFSGEMVKTQAQLTSFDNRIVAGSSFTLLVSEQQGAINIPQIPFQWHKCWLRELREWQSYLSFKESKEARLRRR